MMTFDELSRATVSELEEIISEYPYFQSARMLLAKKLHDENTPKGFLHPLGVDDAVKLAAAYATNREALRNLIENKIKAEDAVPVETGHALSLTGNGEEEEYNFQEY